ncbi:unnamed protein product [Mytilus coruscus]|uniref:Tyr recombinase domain-containing protein n=1 Tax=Mytilus coruscus TaxID=42192 RepID=A0A6J8DFP7_MYTCO|nr:unnamed protein product [Mytilus coruscus]
MGMAKLAKDKHITRFMKGIFNLRPSLPRYTFTWNVGTVLKYLSQLYPNENLSLKMLTLKCIALFALSSAQRSQTLVNLDLRFVSVTDNSLIFKIPVLLKTTKPNKSNVDVIIHKYQKQENCPVRCIKHYILRTKDVRKSKNLFISFKTFKHVTTSTIARWLKIVLGNAGIDINKFKSSFRSASTSATKQAGISLNDILKTANWRSAYTFQKFYFKDIETPLPSYTETVFNSYL